MLIKIQNSQSSLYINDNSFIGKTILLAFISCAQKGRLTPTPASPHHYRIILKYSYFHFIQSTLCDIHANKIQPNKIRILP